MAQHHQPPNNLRPVTRFITDHNTEGLAIFVPETVSARAIPTGDSFYLGYTASEMPIDLTTDLVAYKQHPASDPVFTVSGGTILSVIDLIPGSSGPMHRTLSLDYAVVLQGAVELVLDSGEARTLQQGDMVIQRGTLHQWRNAGKTEWARVLFVLQESRPVEVAGKTLQHEFRFE